MMTLLAIDAVIFNPDQYLPHIVAGLTVVGIVFEILFEIYRSIKGAA